ncbi:hypothetical protein [Thermus scotoductus]|uniref:Uncharacterized protein n=3 Tax=Thermus scotoductus TaxID=37636 RepID=A0A430QZ70_THESC|nr:hypothetical protein [Thermus scotoductus]RTH00452.1 hypothetical protein CSW45_13540 [Thermus scotoductus]RTH16034.1 hypothetical protein CSW42_13820 [Thermus scotoductus]RTH96116.1 hypothetical protein CSW28_13890 [Thermus scotoductus]RTI17585.1 hypothetical protein CSW21_13225 [Thermus scotoductus]
MKDETLLYLLLAGAAGAAIYFAWKANQPVNIPIHQGNTAGGAGTSPSASPSYPSPYPYPQPSPGSYPYPQQPNPTPGQQVGGAVDQFLGGVNAIVGAIGAIGNLFGGMGGGSSAGSSGVATLGDAFTGSTSYTWDPWSQTYVPSDSYAPSDSYVDLWNTFTGEPYDPWSTGYETTAPVGSYAGWL